MMVERTTMADLVFGRVAHGAGFVGVSRRGKGSACQAVVPSVP